VAGVLPASPHLSIGCRCHNTVWEVIASARNGGPNSRSFPRPLQGRIKVGACAAPANQAFPFPVREDVYFAGQAGYSAELRGRFAELVG
jgi:hypothetical protein